LLQRRKAAIIIEGVFVFNRFTVKSEAYIRRCQQDFTASGVNFVDWRVLSLSLKNCGGALPPRIAIPTERNTHGAS
jgi:hypothetical protein